jgi:cell division protein FtsA
MSSRITAGIDVGTFEVRVVVAEQGAEGALPKVLGTGKSESKGLRHGYIINIPDVERSVIQAVRQAEKTASIKIRRAYLSIGGVGLSGITSQGSSIVSRADQEITEADLDLAVAAAESAIPPSLMQNREIIYSIPISWKVDGKPAFGRILGMKGVKIEAKAFFISCIEPHLDDLVEAVEEAGIEIIDVVASPIAASFVTLSKSQKIAGCVLANIGAETVSIVVFENNIPISLEVYPIGGADITNDIALGLRISLEEAESIKLGGVTATNYSKKKLEEIISARLSDIFELIEAHLKKIGKSGLLPAGIIITGGSSSLGLIEDLARSYLKLPSRIASLNIGGSVSASQNGKFQIRDSSWSVAFGLCVLGNVSEEDSMGITRKTGKNLLKDIWRFFSQYLP